MTLFISGDLYTRPRENNVNSGVIGWDNLATRTNVSADSEAEFFPVANAANPITYSLWKSESTATQYLTVELSGSDDVDYVAVARHNFGSGKISIGVEGAFEVGGDWSTLVLPVSVADDVPFIIRLPGIQLTSIRLVFYPIDTPPSMGVLHVGELMVLERRVYVGHTPIVMGVTVNEAVGLSMDGNFLGSIVHSEGHRTSVSLSYLTPQWVREKFEPFKRARVPFFYAWRPDDYPLEVGYCWFPANHVPTPANQLPNGMMAVQFDMEGLASINPIITVDADAET